MFITLEGPWVLKNHFIQNQLKYVFPNGSTFSKKDSAVMQPKMCIDVRQFYSSKSI